jgi:hypothetical protein
MEDGGWRMEDGGWRMEDGGWRMEDGGWRMEDGGREGCGCGLSAGRAARDTKAGRREGEGAMLLLRQYRSSRACV